MKERPILFSAPMVLALLSGRKTQTRRLVQNVEAVSIDGKIVDCVKDWDGGPSRLDMAPRDWEICPYGVPGERLWVKETWRPFEDTMGFVVRYAADSNERLFAPTAPPDDWRMPKAAKTGNVSPLYMPRWASRLTLEITSVRVERLRDISEEDAAAEGTAFTRLPFESHGLSGYEARIAFAELWDSINGERAPWESNPWLWVLEFRRVTAKERAA